MNAEHCFQIFNQAIADYHRRDDVNQPESNPHAPGSLEHLLYYKNWIDTVQWHLEDLARVPDALDATIADLKRRIDRSNQKRTDTVEIIDDTIAERFRPAQIKEGARLNSETPAWLLDRMSILALKIFHMEEQTRRNDAANEHIARCKERLAILKEQERDLSLCFDQLLEEIQAGQRTFKVYRQMKMYNDKNLNPALYSRK